MRRGCDEFIGYGKNPYSKVFALNLPKNQLTQLNDDTIDELFRRLIEDFSIKPENCPIFYLYDRDFLSYKPNQLRGRYVKRYTDPYGNADGTQGQLLLSYPAIESYLLSCTKDNVYQQSFLLGKDMKPKLVQNISSESAIVTDDHLIHAVLEMDKGLDAFGYANYDLDDLAPTLLGVYDIQQQRVKTCGSFSLLSLVSMALLELGVIIECDE